MEQSCHAAGHVRAAGTNEPLSGAQITVVGTQQRAASDESGAFRIAGLTGSDVTLDVRRIGYRNERLVRYKVAPVRKRSRKTPGPQSPGGEPAGNPGEPEVTAAGHKKSGS